MKKLLLALAVVGATLFTACNKDHNDGGKHDHTADLVGTWTCIREDFAEALVIKADGSVLSTGAVFGEEYWEDVKGKIVVENGNVTMTFEDGDNFKGHFDIIPGMAFSISNDEGRRFTYNYCKEDLADEVVGMWVCNETTSSSDQTMYIMTYNQDGTAVFTAASTMRDDYLLTMNYTYKVVGDLLIRIVPEKDLLAHIDQYTPSRIVYNPNGTSFGDILTQRYYAGKDGDKEEVTNSFLRIKQHLELEGNKYDYIKTYVSNVKGEDKDINFMGYTFNFAKMDGSGLDKMLKALLFAVEFPNANQLTYSYQLNNNTEAYDAKIVVEGNKMTIKMSDKVATLKDVVLYAFQDADCSQLHFYMHKTAFVNFYTNMQAMLMEATDEQFDINNAEAVNAIYNEINNAVETINVSLVMSK